MSTPIDAQPKVYPKFPECLASICLPKWRGEEHTERVIRNWGAVGAYALALAYWPEGVP